MRDDYGQGYNILVELVKMEPFHDPHGIGTPWCFFCYQDSPGHYDDCPWARAEKILKENPPAQGMRK